MSYFPVHRHDRDRILQGCGEASPSTLCVWVALCDLANAIGSWTFERRQAEIARLAGISTRATQSALKRLRELGMISWENLPNDQGGHGVNQYRLLTHEHRPRFRGNFTPPDEAIPAKQVPSPIREKSTKREIPQHEHRRDPVSSSARISLEKERDRLTKEVSDLRSDLPYFQGAPRDQQLQKIAQRDLHLSEISQKLKEAL